MIGDALAYSRCIEGFVTKKMEIVSPDRVAQIPIPSRACGAFYSECKRSILDMCLNVRVEISFAVIRMTVDGRRVDQRSILICRKTFRPRTIIARICKRIGTLVIITTE